MSSLSLSRLVAKSSAATKEEVRVDGVPALAAGGSCTVNNAASAASISRLLRLSPEPFPPRTEAGLILSPPSAAGIQAGWQQPPRMKRRHLRGHWWGSGGWGGSAQAGS